MRGENREHLPAVTFILLITVRGNKPFLPQPEEKQVLHIKASTIKYLSKCLSPLPWTAEFSGSSLTDQLFSFRSTKRNFLSRLQTIMLGNSLKGA